jgi:large subunit ribosomal protein L1
MGQKSSNKVHDIHCVFFDGRTIYGHVKKETKQKITTSKQIRIDPKYANQQLRKTVVFTHGTGHILKIADLVSREEFAEAQNAKADILGSEELIEDISKGILNFDLLVATVDMMPKLAKFGRILGPKGLMPSLKAGTVTTNVESTIKEFRKGKLEYRADKTGIVHVIFGKANFSELELIENLKEFYHSIEISKPSGVKGKYFKKLIICSTMGPGISINLECL